MFCVSLLLFSLISLFSFNKSSTWVNWVGKKYSFNKCSNERPNRKIFYSTVCFFTSMFYTKIVWLELVHIGISKECVIGTILINSQYCFELWCSYLCFFSSPINLPISYAFELDHLNPCIVIITTHYPVINDENCRLFQCHAKDEHRHVLVQPWSMFNWCEWIFCQCISSEIYQNKQILHFGSVSKFVWQLSF